MALEVLAQEYASAHISLRILAERVNLSPGHLSRALTQRTGASYATHLTRLRMQRGRSLLEHTPLTVKEIAAAVGYTRTSEFDRNFVRTFGVTPGEFRRQLVAKGEPVAEGEPHS